jgi:hypothetical protein
VNLAAWLAALAAVCAPMSLIVPGTVRACHGPGTAAGGVQVWSARPIPRGSFAVLLRADYTRFEPLSPQEIENLTLAVSGDHTHLHVVERSTLATLGLSYGLTDDLELGVLFAYYAASGVGEGHAHGGASYEFSDYGDVDGPADTWVAAKYRVHTSAGGDVALIGGVKAPTGDDHVVVDGVAIDQALQPGSGSWDASLAIAFTRDLGERLLMDASAQYVLRTEANAYQVGDQANLGVALAMRIIGDARADRWLWGFVESSVRMQAENEEAGGTHVNSGGTTVFLTPGLRGDLPGGVSAGIGLQLPVVEVLNDVQQGIDYKLTGSLTVSF